MHSVAVMIAWYCDVRSKTCSKPNDLQSRVRLSTGNAAHRHGVAIFYNGVVQTWMHMVTDSNRIDTAQVFRYKLLQHTTTNLTVTDHLENNDNYYMFWNGDRNRRDIKEQTFLGDRTGIIKVQRNNLNVTIKRFSGDSFCILHSYLVHK